MKAEEKKLVLEAQQVAATLKEVERRLGDDVQVSTSAERQNAAQPRHDWESPAAKLATIAKEEGLKIPDNDPEEMLRLIEEAAALEEVEVAAEQILERARDTKKRKREAAWKIFLAHYNLLTAIGANDVDVARKLTDIVEFMANGPRPKKADNSDKEVTTPVVTPPKAVNG